MSGKRGFIYAALHLHLVAHNVNVLIDALWHKMIPNNWQIELFLFNSFDCQAAVVSCIEPVNEEQTVRKNKKMYFELNSIFVYIVNWSSLVQTATNIINL